MLNETNSFRFCVNANSKFLGGMPGVSGLWMSSWREVRYVALKDHVVSRCSFMRNPRLSSGCRVHTEPLMDGSYAVCT